MACLELYCLKCGHVWFSNVKELCPECGCEDVHAFFDEASDPPDDHEYEEQE